MTKFSVTYEIITEASAEHGDCADCGYLAGNLSLRDALSMVCATESAHCSQSSIEPNDSDSPDWITVYNSANYISGNYENRSLHIPRHVTRASRRRIARLFAY